MALADYEQFRRDMNRFDVSGLREEPFACKYEKLLGDKLREHEIVSVENEQLKVVVVPDLGGRIVSIVLKQSGREIAGRTDPLNYFYPAYGGYEESTTMTWGRTGFANRYTAQVEPRKLTLTSTDAGDLEFQRALTLPEQGTTIEFLSAIKNTGQCTRYARLISHMEVNADPAHAVVGLRRSDGEEQERPRLSCSLR